MTELIGDEPHDSRVVPLEVEKSSYANPFSQVIYYRHQRFMIHDRHTVEGVQQVVTWIEANVPVEHEEYAPLMEIVRRRLVELAEINK